MNRFSSWLLVVGSLAVVLAAVGFLLPPNRTTQRSARYAQTVGDLWTTTTDFTGQARWRRSIERIQALADLNGHPGYREVGEGFERTYEVSSFVAPRLLELRFVDEDGWLEKTWTFAFEADVDGTRLTITETSEVENVFARVVYHFLGDGSDELELFLVELGRLFDEEVTPLAPPREPSKGLDFGLH